MRDLASRLRDIVRSNPPEVRRELTYVPDLPDGAAAATSAAAQLGGETRGDVGQSFVMVDRVWDAEDWHGRRKVGSYAPDAGRPPTLFDPRLAAVPDWASRVVYFDIETTGLSGGAGMIPFLIGCGWFEDDSFRVRQFLLTGPAGEPAMLDALSRIFNDASLLVTYNGRTFDVPVMEMRWAFHRKSSPADDLPHFDMLPPARRLWSTREETSAVQSRSCSLSSLERSVLGFHRLGDVPGMEIPTRYFQFLRTGNALPLEGVLEHNRHDIVSLAAITAHALRLAEDGPESCRDACEQVGLGRLYERAGDVDRARRAYELAAESGEYGSRRDALGRLAMLLRRESRYDEAATTWQRVLDLSGWERGELSPLERRAAEALAIHHEHRVRDLATAKRYAEAMRTDATGRSAAEIEHRLDRIGRKLVKIAPLLRD